MFKLMILFLAVSNGGAEIIEALEWDHSTNPARLEEVGARQCRILNGAAPDDMIVTYTVEPAGAVSPVAA